MSKSRKKRTALFVLEIVVLLLFVGALYIYGQVSTKMDKIEQPVLDEEKIVVNEQAPQMTGYTTYALFAVDTRAKTGSAGGENSDTIIVASVNNDTKDVKLVSVYRDTLLNIGEGTYAKANAAYAYGGPEQAISMLNTSLDLQISDYATVDFGALATVVDLLGGLDVPMSYAELVFMNDYCVETSKETDLSYTPIELPERPENIEETIGTYHLNGVQAVSYCRIRYTASLDMGRTERQRRVIEMLVSKAKTAGLTTIFKIMDEVFPMVQTSVSKTELLQLLPTLIGYSIGDTTGFPFDYKFSNVRGSIIVPTSLESNVIKLHEFLYGATDYTPSDEILNASQRILEIAGGEENMVDAIDPATAEAADNDITYIWTENPDNTITYDEYDYSEPTTDSSSGSNGADTDNTVTEPEDPGYTEPVPDDGSGDYDDGSGDYDDGSGDYDDGSGDIGDVGGGDVGSGDVGGGDVGGGDVGGGDVGGGDAGGGDVGGGDVGGGDVGGGDAGGGDVVDGGGSGGGDVGGGDAGGGEMIDAGGMEGYAEPVTEPSAEAV